MIAVLVPVLGRPASAQPLADSLASATAVAHRLIFICSRRDEAKIAACRATSAEVMIVPWEPRHADFAKKINHAFSLTDEPFIFQGADDIRFHPGWDVQALALAHKTGAGVIGTNDLGNPMVKRGKTSTHSLIRRAYIEEQGGTFDGTGTVFSEAYDHQYVDNELCEVARMRGQFAFAQRSTVEHLHPHWGRGTDDEIYRKGQLHTLSDRKLFQQRMAQMRKQTSRLARQR